MLHMFAIFTAKRGRNPTEELVVDPVAMKAPPTTHYVCLGIVSIATVAPANAIYDFGLECYFLKRLLFQVLRLVIIFLFHICKISS